MELFLICLLIYSAKTLEISLKTIKNVFVAKGQRNFGAIAGVFEAFAWVLIIGNIINDLTSAPWKIVAFCLGAGTGILVGSWVERKMGIGNSTVTIITTEKDTEAMTKTLHQAGFGTTTIQADGYDMEKRVIYVITQRKRKNELIALATAIDPHVFIFTNDSKQVVGGFFTK